LIFDVHFDLKWVGYASIRSAWVLSLLIDIDMLITSDDETSTEGYNNVNLDLLVEWRVRDVGDIGAICITENDLTDVVTDGKLTI